MPKPVPDSTIFELAERIADEVGDREPDWASLVELARELVRLCEARAAAS